MTLGEQQRLFMRLLGEFLVWIYSDSQREVTAGELYRTPEQAKLNAATSALQQGVGQVRIAPGAAPQILSRVLAGEMLGTRLV